ncbi:MAG: AAA family ATPase [Bacillota bacterium]
MLRFITIVNFNDQGTLELDLSQNLTILTGDNGAGKTTILNLIFNILNGDFKNVNKVRFEKIILELNVNNSASDSIVKTIEINNYSDGLEINYFLLNSHYCIDYKKVNLPFAEYSYELKFPKDETEESDSRPMFLISSICEEIENLIAKHKQLEFINILKENIIYFPTYRRIDSDIFQLMEQSYIANNEEDFNLIKKAFNQFPHDGRVVGVNDEDIDRLFKSYSERCRKLNSEGLNRVLKSFIEELIISTYNNGLTQSLNNEYSDLYVKAPEQLIELSKELGIEKINEKEIRDYFANHREVMDNLSNNKTSSKSNKKRGDFENLKLLLLRIGENNNNLIMRLIDLYDKHMKKVNKELEPFEYLRRSFKAFFKDKIQLYFYDYSIELSLHFRHLSTGEKQLITLLSYAALSLGKKTYKPLIIIDEPELSLHISWQMKLLASLLELPDINILLATHSPYIANSDYENYIWQLGEIDAY